MSGNEEEKNIALKFAMKLIGLRRRSEFEIRQRLKSKRISREMTDEIVEELKKYNYVDDEKFAESYINDRINLHPAGRYLIKMELKSKGIRENIIDDALNEILDIEKELEIAGLLFEKKLKTINSNDPRKVRIKVMNYLKTKGFSSGTIGQLIKNKIELDQDKNF